MLAQIRAAIEHFEMQMREPSGGEPCCTQRCNLLAPLNAIACLDQALLQMNIIGLRDLPCTIPPVINLDPMAIARLPMRRDHAPLCGGQNRRADWCMHIYAKVIRDLMRAFIKRGAPKLLGDGISVLRHHHGNRLGI